MRERVVKLSGGRACEDAIGGLEIGQLLTVIPDVDDPDRLLFFGEGHDEVGYLTWRHPVSQDVKSGIDILHVSVSSINWDVRDETPTHVRVRIVTGQSEQLSEAAPAPVLKIQMRSFVNERRPTKYTIGIVGESFCQEVIASLIPGDPVVIEHEQSNPHDENAVVVVVPGKGKIGYLARDSRLQTAVARDGKKLVGSINSVGRGDRGHLGVLLDVAIA